MSNMLHNGKLHIVMCTAGLHEIYGEWPVAVFTDPLSARDWCDKANVYGAWMAKMTEKHWEDEAKVERVPFEEGDDWDEYSELACQEPSSQYHWALHGSPGQEEAWEEEFEEQHPEGDWCYYQARELSLILNPYDEKAYWARDERRIEYKVVELLLDPDRPYFP
jgi:hypothetical protein